MNTSARSDGVPAATLRRISELVAAGVNLAGIAGILDLEDDNAALHAANYALSNKAKKNPETGRDNPGTA